MQSCPSPAEREATRSQELAFEELKMQLAGAVLAESPRVHLARNLRLTGGPMSAFTVPTPTVCRHQCWRSRARVRFGPSLQ